MPPYFFDQGLKVTADVYLKVLQDVVVPWMKKVAAGRHFIFQQDGAPAHNAKKTQKWLAENVPEFWEKEIWPPSSPDINPLDYFVWGVVERDTNRTPHTTLKSLKAKIKEVMTSMNRNMVKRACGSFRKRLSTVIEKEGDLLE
jgi:inhibitor of nuclear factor kappa-B kinase subunit alpha